MDYSVALERIQRVRERFPEKGLFAQKEWLISPQPFLISAAICGRTRTTWALVAQICKGFQFALSPQRQRQTATLDCSLPGCRKTGRSS